ncbi:MAG: FGGY-family carbohydrate kinase [Alphaproteobacteria bacterium]|nr:FGGY-family carbohydrate kinase [Alphaproteobacteria bacterium]
MDYTTPVWLGIDVGTGSARAGLFTSEGRLLATARHEIAIWREDEFVEQSSEDVWHACAAATRTALANAAIPPDQVKGLSFTGTCSLVVLDRAMRPVGVGASGDANRNIIVWMDHRAVSQAQRINATGDEVLTYVGGAISPEMQTPKLLWLCENLPDCYASAGQFFDLVDYLTWRATGSLVRSVCTVTCKWTYLAHERRWSDRYFTRIGLPDIPQSGYARIGPAVADPGTALGSGLTAQAAAELGLSPGTPVGAGLIDAHAGGIGSIGGRSSDGDVADPVHRIAFIMGTSNCTMAVSREPRFVPGVWGPYFSAMIPGLWLMEGGQSAGGAAIDHLVRLHPGYPAAALEAAQRGLSVLDLLEAAAMSARTASDTALLAQDVHALPEFLGNRSPFADPKATAVLAGLVLEDSRDSLVRLYVAGLCGLAYGAAQILDALAACGYELDTIVMSGGAAKSRLVRQITADATGLDVIVPVCPEPVLLGAAMLGAVAAGAFGDLGTAMAAMAQDGARLSPARGRVAAFHAAKREVFEDLQRVERRARQIMAKSDYGGSA